MTDPDLLALIDRRADALAAMDQNGKALRDLTPQRRGWADQYSAIFRQCDWAIVAELVARAVPVVIGARRFVLTKDRLNFVETDLEGRIPGTSRKDTKGYQTALYEYEGAGR